MLSLTWLGRRAPLTLPYDLVAFCAILDAIGASTVQQGRKKQFDVSILQAGLGRNSCDWSVRCSTGEKSFHMQI